MIIDLSSLSILSKNKFHKIPQEIMAPGAVACSDLQMLGDNCYEKWVYYGLQKMGLLWSTLKNGLLPPHQQLSFNTNSLTGCPPPYIDQMNARVRAPHPPPPLFHGIPLALRDYDRMNGPWLASWPKIWRQYHILTDKTGAVKCTYYFTMRTYKPLFCMLRSWEYI